MLFPAPYDVPEKTAKGTRSGLRRKGASDMSSEDETDSSAAEDGGEEEEESGPPLRGKEEEGGLHKSRGGGIQEGEEIPRG